MRKIPIANVNFRILIKGEKFKFVLFLHENTLINFVDLGKRKS